MNDDPGHYVATTKVLGHEVTLTRLQAGDVLVCRPRDPLSQAQVEAVHRQLNVMAGQNPEIRIVLVPSTWDIAVARYQPDQDAIQGLRGLIQDLGG